jgi:hypothetical protein
MPFSQLQRGLFIAANLFILVTRAGASDLTVEVVNSRTAPAKVHLYNKHTNCRSGYLSQNFGHYDFDQCHKLDPFAVKELQILEPAVCASGTKALFTLFRSPSCNEGFGSASMEMSDDVVGKCMSVRSWRSFAFICDGIVEEERGTVIDLSSWISPWAAFLLIAATLFLALSLGTAFLFCGGFVMLMGGLGLLFWGFWSLGKGIVVS